MRSINRVPKDLFGFKKYTQDVDHAIFIFGADIAGKIINELLAKEGIEISGFIDNNKNKCDSVIGGRHVFHAPYLSSLNRDTIILIASTYIGDIIRQVEDLGFYNWVPIAEILKGTPQSELSDLLKGQLRKNHAGGEFTKDFDTFVLSNMITSQDKYLDHSRLYVRSVDLIITEKCSLKCKDCSNLMQYYEAPVNIGEDELLKDIDDICAIADEINEIRVIGGDPLMNRDFHNIVAYAASKHNVNRVVVYTNGTICPSEDKIAAMANDKVFVFITTYGELSRRNELLAELLKKYDIPYNSQPAYGWTDCADIKKHKRSEIENEEIMRMCCAKHFTTLTDGKVFRCPFSANVERLSAIPESPDDYISIRGASLVELAELEELRSNLHWFLREKSSIKACDFCNGRTYGDPEINPGVQTKQPLQYIKYTRRTELTLTTC
jgi:hypothetical protein